LRISNSPIIFPTTNEDGVTCRRCRLLEIPYSETSFFNDFPLLALVALNTPGFERYFLLNGNNTIVPTTAQMRPTGRNVKKPRPGKPFDISSSFITRLGGVPIRVIIPLILLAKASGISRRLGFIFTLIAILTTIGIIMATVPVLLTKAPITEVTPITIRKSFVSLFPANFISLELIILARPVWKIAPPTTNRPTIIIITLLEKPERASSGVSTPARSNVARAERATISERTLPLMKKTTDNNKTRIVIIINYREIFIM
jgi:hypothetical protein